VNQPTELRTIVRILVTEGSDAMPPVPRFGRPVANGKRSMGRRERNLGCRADPASLTAAGRFPECAGRGGCQAQLRTIVRILVTEGSDAMTPGAGEDASRK